ncbi:PH domain-containing protein [Glycomyces sp. NRRL B-16210]|uniref:PH domain-containing protein n=1 Tax=Glycomyces sp. NRRL B-16210 TaxID=1463821 RepID=UPI0004C2421E|nr:PH domain-containing protein [Glycomyces sp. NRRL B-16210]
MRTPTTLRCRAAVARRVVAVVLLGYMSAAVPVYLVVEGGAGAVELLFGGCLYLLIVAAAIAHAFGLRCRMILDEEGVTFVEPLSEVRFRWDEITAIAIGGDSHTWEVEVRTLTGGHRPGSLKCLKWFGRPRSLRRTVETLERYRARAGAAAADS